MFKSTRVSVSPFPTFILVLLVSLAFGTATSVQKRAQAQAGSGAGTIRFAVIGDYGYSGSDEAAVANLVTSWDPDLVITVGDNNYDQGDASTIDQNIGQYYQHFIYPYSGSYGSGSPTGQNRFFPTLGNHDWDSSAGVQPFTDYFTLPGNERYYDFVVGDVHFFALSSDVREPDGVVASSIQGQWLQQRLASSTKAWQVVYFHHAPFSSGQNGSSLHMRWPFATWGVDAVLAGHDHSYERLNVGGLPYIVNGLGGKSIYGFNAPMPESIVRYNANYGALRVDANACSMTLAFYAVTDQLVDSLTLEQSCSGQTTTPLPTGASTRTPTPTPTLTQPPPNCPAVLDCFNRANGGLGGGNWVGDVSAFAIQSNQLRTAYDQSIYWVTSFGNNQRAAIQLGTLDVGDQVALHLKAINNYWGNGVIEVAYVHNFGVVVHTFDGVTWIASGNNIAASFAPGDVIEARAFASGILEIYKNGGLIATRDITSWPFNARSGQIGLWTVASSTLLDNFDGGNIGAPANTPTPTPTAMPTTTPTHGQAATATATRTPSPTPLTTPTSTSTSAACVFPSTATLDTFNRANGPVGNGWTGDTALFSIQSNQLRSGGDAAIYWPTSFNSNQEAFVKLGAVPSGAQLTLHLKAIGSNYNNGVLEVNYTAGTGLRIYTLDTNGWAMRGGTTPLNLSAGDVFGARTEGNVVKVFKNGALIGTFNLSGWAYVGRNGQVGLWTDVAAIFVNEFGGGSATCSGP